MNSNAELEKLLAFARRAAHEGGCVTLDYFQQRITVDEKADGSPVTVADRNAEAHIRHLIEEAYPDHGIYGEEFGVKDPRNGCSFTWYIDPIDGTKSFIHGVPLYTTLLGLLCDGESAVGVIDVPGLGLQLSAGAGFGASLDGTPARVSDVAALDKALCLTTDERALPKYKPGREWEPLWQGARLTRGWGDGYGHLLVACGRAEFILDPKVEPYDVAPFPVIMREAGGRFFAWNGEETIHGGDGISCNAALADEILRTVRG